MQITDKDVKSPYMAVSLCICGIAGKYLNCENGRI